MLKNFNINPKLDLVLERTVDVPRELVWKAWTTPEHLKKWFCPKPWQTTKCTIDLRVGGLFHTTMQGPEGDTHGGNGCYLEIIENERLTWTSALEADFRPNAIANDCINDHFTATVLLENHKGGTKYTVIARHTTEETCKAHNERGFEAGWGTALEQMVELIKNKAIK